MLTNEIAGRGYPHYNSLNAFLSLVITVIFDLLLIPRYGILGAAMASSLAYTVNFLAAVTFYLVVSGSKLSPFIEAIKWWKQPYSLNNRTPS